jgi:hypothetical protein
MSEVNVPLRFVVHRSSVKRRCPEAILGGAERWRAVIAVTERVLSQLLNSGRLDIR